MNTEQQGLSSLEAKKRLEQYGENTLEEKKFHPFLKLLSYFWGPIPWMIEIAAILSASFERWADLTIILALLFINAAIGFFQEYKADNAIEELKKKLALKARVLRDGKWQEILAKKLVPGDIIAIRLGNVIPADVKLLSGEYLSVDQSTLTGESLPVDKKVGDEAFSGTIIKLGEMVGEVTKTGSKTLFGQTATLVEKAQTVSHFQEAVLKIGHFLIFTTLIIASIIFIVFFFRIEMGNDLKSSFADIFIFILVLVIAGIPVALPAVLSTTLAIGANHMAKLKAIVSKLSAIEELAGMDVLCSDKTGTLTKNELAIRDISSPTDVSKEEILLYACLASTKESGDSIDELLFKSLNDQKSYESFKTTKFIPFDPTSKRTTATLQTQDGKTEYASKGAPQVILENCQLTDEIKAKVNKQIEDLAKQGYRTLGVAKSGAEGPMQFLGLIALYDPPRDDSKSTIASIKEMGIKVKMVTGDHVSIAKVIANELDIGRNIYPMKDVFTNTVGEKERAEILINADGFAEVYPKHKFELVKNLQDEKHIVGMTGDGVNDAPALKQADIGIAVSNATDAAKAAADLVLTDPGLSVIKTAIVEARAIFGRMKSYSMYRISETCRLLLFLFLAIILFNTHPLTTVMIIMIALLNDIPIMMIAYDHMQIKKDPETWNMREVLFIAVGLAIVGVISTFGLFWMGKNLWLLGPAKSQTLAFMAILCGGNLTIYLTRNRGFFWEKPWPQWKFFLATLFSQVIGTLVSVYGLGSDDFVGIGWKYASYSWIYLIAFFGVCVITKSLLYYLIEAKAKHYHQKFFSKVKRSFQHHPS